MSRGRRAGRREKKDLAFERLADGGDRTLKIADGVVGVGELSRKQRQRIAASGDQPFRPVVEHDVADEDQAHRGD